MGSTFTGDKRPAPDDLKKAEVWEIWDKSRRKRVWIVKGHDKPLRIDDDPYGLEEFFPLPAPLVAVADTQTLVPRPEYFEYRDQAEDLDEIVGRISRLTRALKRRGVYDQAVKELKRLATAGDNQFIPVENWQALSSKGGLQAAFQTEDISGIAAVLLIYLVYCRLARIKIDIPCLDTMAKYLYYAFLIDFSLEMLDLIHPMYQATAAYGHFGREPAEMNYDWMEESNGARVRRQQAFTAFSWERTDRAEALRKAAGL